MSSPIKQKIQQIYNLEDDLLEKIMFELEQLEYPARFKLIKAGTVANKIFFIEKGACRSYYLKDGKEITTWFAFENEFITSFYSVISTEPSKETIELLEDSVFWALRFESIDRLSKLFPPINHLYRKVLEMNFIIQEKLLNERFSSAKEKYENLIHKFPEILQRVPLGYIASYLGITQSTLSRIRSQY